MSIVLSILQVIGWILLVVLSVILLVLLLVLFCPVRYFIEGELLEKQWAKAKVHWLLQLLGVKVSYEEDLIYGEFWILWIKHTFSLDLTKKENEAGEEKREEITKTTAELRENVPAVQKDIINDETSEDRVEDRSNHVIDEDINEDEKTESIIFKIKGIIERIKEVCDKIKKILSDEKNQKAITHIKKEIIYLIKVFLPKKSKIDAVFSTGSPDTTGQLFGILACFPAMYHKNWKLLPDFESDDAYLKGSFWGVGRIYGCQIVGIILRILFDKNCRRLYTIINRFLKWMKKNEKSEVK